MVMGRLWNSRLRSEQASSLIELTLTLPLLLFLILGVIDLGRGYRTYSALATGAHEGARWLTTHPTDVTGAHSRVVAEANRAGVQAAALTITITPAKSSYAAGDTVTVAVTHNYPLMFGAITGIGSVPFTVRAMMQVLYE
jgi:Flp pilus assembly protein TadG